MVATIVRGTASGEPIREFMSTFDLSCVCLSVSETGISFVLHSFRSKQNTFAYLDLAFLTTIFLQEI
jgi:hypothetical protein